MICNKKYHFLLPSKAGVVEYCRSNVIEFQGESHSLHGVFHSNGLGHLLCINGSEAGSELAGYQIMEFWDRLCSGLGARFVHFISIQIKQHTLHQTLILSKLSVICRKVSLRDVAKKKSMDLRLLHTVAYGKPWFGHWDYTFGRASFGVNQETYQSAVKAIQNIPLSLIAHQPGFGSYTQNEIQVILPKYQVLSGHSLVTLGDLFHFMMELKFRIPKEKGMDSHYPGIILDASCRWSPKRVEMAIHVVVEALKRAEFQWVSRQHVRDVARAYIGDTGLLDFVLKSLGNHMVGKYFVRRCLNPVTKVLEYCLEDVSRTFPKQEVFPIIEAKSKPQKKISWAQVMKDMFYIYKNIFGDQTKNGVLATIPVASRIILDSKYFIKEYCGEKTTNGQENKRKIYCRVILQNEAGAEEAAATTPCHCFVLTDTTIFDELRTEVEKTFRETYFVLTNFAADSIKNMNPKGSDLVFKMVPPGGKIEFLFRQEGISGESLMVVDCPCGTKDDDGERMIRCDICQAWQHTRCVQIPDNDEIPNIFLCSACDQNIFRLRCYATTSSI